MSQVKIYVFQAADNKFDWEAHPNVPSLSGGPFETQPSAIKNLEAVILSSAIYNINIVIFAGIKMPNMYFPVILQINMISATITRLISFSRTVT
ncbi:hypothetical protein [Edwardsiella ictaluri]|uniref:hypothetical protein n=1 Tax=Edwardsiella ictaluri TaxID=67780 RepID=UPI0039F672C0